ncbi:MAG: ABC transporter permease [Thermodesulfobacteriota bacterium]|nr:ABC transporter permease [Thermodesulfobacteriota bacterium]
MTFLSSKNSKKPQSPQVVTIKARSGWQAINLKELVAYRDLFGFLVWRDIKVLYAQTILGFLWALLQPLVQIIIFTFIFGKVAKLPTEGMPYVVFSTVAVIPWTYISQAMSASSQSLVSGQNMLGKVYFPRLIFPITPVLAKLVDFSLSLLIVLGVLVYYRIAPTWNLILLPVFIMLMVSVATGVGLWFSAMAIRFRDVKLAMPFAIRMLMYTAPIVYSASSIPGTYRTLYSFNPIVSVIEGFRACLLGTPFAWQYILPGMITALVILVSGAFYFQRMERVFVDVI